MQLAVVGLNQSSAPLSVRERVSLAPERAGGLLARLPAGLTEGFILSTCNRTEIYAVVAHAASGARQLAEFFARSHGLAVTELEPHLYTHVQAAAARHLFRVTSGLDSMVLGEDQIVAQVKSALHQAQEAGSLGPWLHRLGSAALAASKRVRADTGLARSPVSVMSVALDAAHAELESLEHRRVVVVGAGRTADAVVRLCLSRAPSAAITVVNRTPERARELAARCGVEAAPWAALPELLSAADLLVTAVSALSPVVLKDDLARALPTGRRLIVLDLSVPRAVDPAAATIPGLTIHDVDALQERAVANRRRREGEVAAAEAIIAECTERFSEWWRAREVAPAIRRLRARADSIRDSEQQRALARLPGLTSNDQLIVREMADRLINKLLHQPMTNLKQYPDGANLATALDRLFAPTES